MLCFFSIFCAQVTAQEKLPTLQFELVQFAKSAEPRLNERRVRAQFSVFCLEVKTALAGKVKAKDRASAFVRYFFNDQKFRESSELADPENLYVDKVLARRQGYCLSLSLILLSVAERLKLPVFLVATPQHVFLRWQEDGQTINIETTLEGAFKPDAFYLERGISKESIRAGVYFKNLARNEILGHLWNNDGFVKWCAGDLDGAEGSFKRAILLHPKLAEAYVNRGVVAGERGYLDVAKDMFGKAARWLPQDATLHLNRAALALKENQTRKAARALRALKKIGASAVAARVTEATLRRGNRWQALQQSVLSRTEVLARKGKLARGLSATYFNDLAMKAAVHKRVDRRINFEWRWSPPFRDMNRNAFAVQWDGFFKIPEAGKYGFYLVFEQGTRLSIDGLVVLDFPNGKKDKLAQVILNLNAGIHEIKAEYWARKLPNGIILEIKRTEARKPLGPQFLLHQR